MLHITGAFSRPGEHTINNATPARRKPFKKYSNLCEQQN